MIAVEWDMDDVRDAVAAINAKLARLVHETAILRERIQRLEAAAPHIYLEASER